MAGRPTTIPEYIEAAPAAAQPALRELYAILGQVAPDATESIKWGQPTFDLHRILYCFAGYKDHANLMPTPATLDAFRDELGPAGLTATRGVLQIPYTVPFPADLVRRIAEHRARDLRDNDAKYAV